MNLIWSLHINIFVYELHFMQPLCSIVIILGCGYELESSFPSVLGYSAVSLYLGVNCVVIE